MPSWWPWAAPALLMLGLGLWGVDRGGSLYSGEAATFWAAHLSWSRLWLFLHTVDAVHGTYYGLMHLVFALGSNPVVLRLPSVAGAVGSVILTAVLAARLGASRLLAFTAATLVALSPSVNEYAQNGRSYALVMMGTLLASLALLRAVRTDRPGDGWARVALRWVAYAAVLTLCGYLHELSLYLLLPAHGVSLLWARVGPRRFLAWLASAAVAATLVLPLVLVSVREDRAVGVLPVPGWSSLAALATVVLGSSAAVAAVLGLLAVVGAVAGRVPAGPGLPRRLTLPVLAVPLLLVPPALMVAESRLGKSLWDDRYLLFVLPGAMLLAAGGVNALARLLRGARLRRLVWLPVVVVLALTASLQWSQQQWLRTPGSRGWDMIAAADYLHRHARPGDGVDYLPRDYNYLPEVYPWAVRDAQQFRLRVSPAASATLHGLPRHGPALRTAMLAHDRIWLVGNPHRQGRPGRLSRLGPFYRHHYALRSAHRWRGISVLLFVRTRR